MENDHALDRRGMDRRKFIGAAAGAAAAGAAVTTGRWSSPMRAGAETVDPCADGRIPKSRYAYGIGNLPGSYWASQAAFGTFMKMCKQVGLRGLEPFSGGLGYYSNIANFGGAGGGVQASMNMWAAAGSVTKAAGVRMMGDHNTAQTAATQTLTNSAILKANRWDCDSFGAGGGNPSFTSGATSTAQWTSMTNDVANWQAAADTINLYGMRFQHGFNLDDQGPFGELAPCQRYYRHFHGEAAGYIFNTGSIYDGHYTMEVYFNEVDPKYGFAQVDLAWCVDGLSLGRGGPGAGSGTYPAPAANSNAATSTNVGIEPPDANLQKLVSPYLDPEYPTGAYSAPVTGYSGKLRANVQFLPDVVERWQDKMPSFHVKDIGTAVNGAPSIPSGLGTTPASIGSNDPAEGVGNGFAYPGNPAGTAFGSPSLYGEVPWKQTQDTVPYTEIFNRLRNPGSHWYIGEYDNASGNATSAQYWPKHLLQVFGGGEETEPGITGPGVGKGLLSSIQLDRTYIRKNFTGQLCVVGVTNLNGTSGPFTPINPTVANGYTNAAGPGPTLEMDPRIPDPRTTGAQPGYPGSDQGAAIGTGPNPPGMGNYLPGVVPHGQPYSTSSPNANGAGTQATGQATGPAAQMRWPICYWSNETHVSRVYTPHRPPASGGAPACCTEPAISGTGEVGTKLKVADHGEWERKTSSGTGYWCYRWLRSGRLIKARGAAGHPRTACLHDEECSSCGDQGKTYVVKPEDVGYEITCEVTRHNGDGSTVVVSNSVAVVPTDGPEAIQEPKVTIRGGMVRVKGAKWSQSGEKGCVLQKGPSSSGPWTPVSKPYPLACPADDGTWFRAVCTISNKRGEATSTSDAVQAEC